MNEKSIIVEKISKRYNLFKNNSKKSFFLKTFSWLSSQLSKPNDSEYLWAIKDITFSVDEGEVVAIIGKNGSGKSTLLKVLSKITSPTEGFAKLNGSISSLLEVGTGMHPDLTGRENIFYNGVLLGMRKKEIALKLDAILDFSGLEHIIDIPIKRYSSGQRVRLGFSIAAHLEPDILIIDEVLAVGDVEFQRKCLGKMQDIASRGRTVLFVSHNMAAVQNLCNRGILLSNGMIVYDGNVSNCINHYMQLNSSTESKNLKYVKNFQFRGDDNQIKTSFHVGESICIEFVVFTHSKPIVRPMIGLGFSDSFSNRVFTLANHFSTVEIKSIFTESLISIRTSSLNIAPGSYKIYCYIGDSGECLESEEIGELIIIESDYFGVGKLPNANQGIVYIKSDWKQL